MSIFGNKSIHQIIAPARDAFAPNRETHLYFDDPQGNQVGYKNTRVGNKVAGIVGLIQAMGGEFKDSEGNSPPPDFSENLGRQGDPDQRYHFQRIGGGEEHPGFYVGGANLGNIGKAGFMQQVIQNNPDWQFGQTWGQNRYNLTPASLPAPLRHPSTFTQNRKMIGGRPHEWNGTEWVPVTGY